MQSKTHRFHENFSPATWNFKEVMYYIIIKNNWHVMTLPGFSYPQEAFLLLLPLEAAFPLRRRLRGRGWGGLLVLTEGSLSQYLGFGSATFHDLWIRKWWSGYGSEKLRLQYASNNQRNIILCVVLVFLSIFFYVLDTDPNHALEWAGTNRIINICKLEKWISKRVTFLHSGRYFLKITLELLSAYA